MSQLCKIVSLLSCPDDGHTFLYEDGILECKKCNKKYNSIADDFFEILPSEFPKWDLFPNEPKKAQEMYFHEFLTPFSWNRKEGGWGDLANASPGTRAFYRDYTQKVIELLDPQQNAIGIDVSGAVGNCAILLSEKVKTMVNCDLHTPSIITSFKRKKKNMICIRSPYLKLPFAANCFDYVICTDTLIRGLNHEIMLLKEILRILKVNGKALVDFHNLKWFAKNKDICAYKVNTVKKLLNEAGIMQYSIYPIGYVPLKVVLTESLYVLLDNFFKLILPCKRHIVVFTKGYI